MEEGKKRTHRLKEGGCCEMISGPGRQQELGFLGYKLKEGWGNEDRKDRGRKGKKREEDRKVREGHIGDSQG